MRYRALDKDSEGSTTTYGTPSIPNPKTVDAIPYLGYFGALIILGLKSTGINKSPAGFSVAAAQFFPGDSRAYYVSGAPRAADYRGKVSH